MMLFGSSSYPIVRLGFAPLLSLASLGCSSGAPQKSEAPQPSFAASADSPQVHPPSSKVENPLSSEFGAEEPSESPTPQEQSSRAAPTTCDDPTLETLWIGESGAPTPDWWRKIANIEPRSPRTGFYPGARAPTVRVGLSGVDSRPEVTRQYRQNFGRYRICYEASLSKEPKLAGHWLARVAHLDKVCSLQVIDTNLPETFSECLAEAVESHVNVPNASGLLEVVLGFQPP